MRDYITAIPEAEDRGGQEREHLHRVIGQHQVPEVKQLARREMSGEATHNPPSVLNVKQGYIERINVKILKGLGLYNLNTILVG